MKIYNREISSTIFVFASTVAGYFLAYVYELGYLHAYDIDSNFVQITPYQLLAGTLVAGAALVLSGFLISVYALSKVKFDITKAKHRYKKEMRDLGYVTLYAFIISLLFAVILDKSILLLITLGISALIYSAINLEILIYYLRCNKIDMALQKYYSRIDKARKKEKNPAKPIPREVWYITFVLIVVCAGTYVYGTLSSQPSSSENDETKMVKSYTIIEGGEENAHVLVRAYGDFYIIKEYSYRDKKFLDGFKTESIEGKRLKKLELEFAD